MNTQDNNQPETKIKGTFVNAKFYVKGDYITIVIDGNILVRKHVNYLKQILGVEYTRISPVQPTEAQA